MRGDAVLSRTFVFPVAQRGPDTRTRLPCRRLEFLSLASTVAIVTMAVNNNTSTIAMSLTMTLAIIITALVAIIPLMIKKFFVVLIPFQRELKKQATDFTGNF